MANYNVPGVYVEKIASGSQPIEGMSTSVVAFMGVTPRIMNEFTSIYSWSDFVQKATFGAVAPIFNPNDMMAYNIYNFYQNGGGKAYFGSVKSIEAKNATVSQGADSDKVTFNAKYAGAWANNLSIVITKNATDNTKFDVVIGRDYANGKMGTVYEQYTKLSNNVADEKTYFLNALLSSDLITVTISGSAVLAETKSGSTITPLVLAGGVDSNVTDALYVGETGLIHKLDSVTDCSMIVSGGQSATVVEGILSYCTTRGSLYAILDAKDDETIANIITQRNALDGLGEIHYPYIKMTEPITGNTIQVPASGAVAGMYARIDTTYGCWRAGAGAEAQLRGAIGVAKTLTDDEFEKLFAAGVNCILAKPNAGVLMYGARSLGQTYVSDDRLDIFVTQSIKQGTEWALFEINDEKLWLRLTTAISSFLEGLYLKGAFKGSGSGSAYYVVCDSSNNTEATIEKGIVTTEYGYAKNKPAEFVVHQFNQLTASAVNG